jgi:hypothetical protein
MARQRIPLLPLLFGMTLCACGPLPGGPDAGSTPDAGPPPDSGAPFDGGMLPDGGLGITCSGASPSFSTQVHPLFNGCGGEMCHGGTSVGAWPYDALVNVHASRDTCSAALILVTPGNLDQSYLLNKLTGLGMCPNTNQMPSAVYPMGATDIQTIADWICQGAQNN